MGKLVWFVSVLLLFTGCAGGSGLVGGDRDVNLHWTWVGQGYVEELDHRPFQRGQELTVRPIPNLGWEFEGWSGQELLALDDGKYMFLLEKETKLTARFRSDYPYHFVRYVIGTASYPYTFTAMAINQQGKIFALLGSQDKVAVIDGDQVSYWGQSGRDEGELKDPVAIAVDESGHVYVADAHSLRVQKFSENGQFVRQWRQGEYEQHPERVDWRTEHIALDADGNVWAVDFDLFSSQSRIAILQTDGSSYTAWQQQDFATAEDAHPYVNGITLAILPLPIRATIAL